MSSIRFTSFGAATMPLSKIVVDKELDMQTYPIKTNAINEKTAGAGVTVDGLLIKDGVSNSPYRPQAWPTEELDWGDVAAGSPVDYGYRDFSTNGQTFTFFTHSGSGRRYVLKFTIGPGSQSALPEGAIIYVGGVPLVGMPAVGIGESYTSPSFPVDDGETVSITASGSTGACSMLGIQFTNTGVACGAKTFNLTGKWLALGLNMQGLNATVKIQGVEIPYSDYPMYFPIAPTEIKIPGGWVWHQVRPVIEVYK